MRLRSWLNSLTKSKPRKRRQRRIQVESLEARELLTGIVVAGEIASYDFEGASYASTDTEDSTTASPFVDNATGQHASSFGNIVMPAGATSPAVVWAANAARAAVDTYFEFTISLGPDTTEVSFDELTFDALVYDTLGGTTAFNYELYWSVDGFATPVASGVGPSVTGFGAHTAQASVQMDLSGLAPQTSDVTFRFDPVFAPGAAMNGGGAQRGGGVDNVVLTGAATVTPADPGAILTGVLDQIEGLLDDGTLNGGQANALSSKIENALKSLDKEKTGTAVNQLGALQNQIGALVNSGTLTQAEADELLDDIDLAIELIEEL